MTSNNNASIREARSLPGLSTAASSKTNFSKSHQQQPQSIPLSQKYPVNSLQEITLETGEKISGRVFCTDEMTGSIVLQTALAHTTLATELRILSLGCVTNSVEMHDSSTSSGVAVAPLAQPLSKIHAKTLEDRERRAIRLAEENLRHINQKATAVGQAVFDRLLKACGEVIWESGDSTSIIVLNQIQVDEPYQPENCKIITKTGINGRFKQGALEDGSLERVRKIVAAATSTSKT